MNPIPLKDPTGRVCAYLCSTCNHVHNGGSERLRKEAEPWQAENALRMAEACCRCYECKEPLPGHDRGGQCEPCRTRWLASIAAQQAAAEPDMEEITEEEALAILLADELIFGNGRRFWQPQWELDPENPGRLRDTGKGALEGPTTALFVNCNDVFAWGCADAEALPYDEILPLYRASRKNWGATKWCCLRRKQRPQAPVEADMRRAGAWDEELEALPRRTP